MIKTYSQRLLTPYYGQVQIAESERARALAVDGQTCEIQFLHSGSEVLNPSIGGAQSTSHRYRRAVRACEKIPARSEGASVRVWQGAGVPISGSVASST